MSTLNTLSLLEVPVLEWEQGLTFLAPHADLWICNKASLERGYVRLGKVHHIWLQIFLYCSRLPQYTAPNGIYGDKFGTYPTRFNYFFFPIYGLLSSLPENHHMEVGKNYLNKSDMWAVLTLAVKSNEWIQALSTLTFSRYQSVRCQ